MRTALVGIAFAALTAAATGVARATPPPLPAPAAPTTEASPGASPAPGTPRDHGFFTGIQRRDSLLGTLGGIRPDLAKYGITLSASETSEELGNVTGGTRQGFDYDGLLQMQLEVDTQRAFGLRGGTLHASALQIHGSNLSAQNLSTLQTASGIEADRASRLWELWYDQNLDREGNADVKIGQQSLDTEYMVSDNALTFVNTMFGWPLLPSYDLPGGGPAYPLSALGVRLRTKLNENLTVLGGVYNGSPVSGGSPGANDPQALNASGTSFPLDGGYLAIAELQYHYPGLGALVTPDHPQPLSGTYRVGGWYDSEMFDDLTYDTNGLALVDARSTGVPRSHVGNYAGYFVVDQMLSASRTHADRTLSAFARIMGTPLQDRNLIDFSGNLGFTLHEPILHREDDVLGLGFGYGRVGAGAAATDTLTRAALAAGTFSPTRSGEFFTELTYQAQIYPWLQIQPDFQYTFNPGGGLANPATTTTRIGDEAVFGVRAIVQL